MFSKSLIVFLAALQIVLGCPYLEKEEEIEMPQLRGSEKLEVSETLEVVIGVCSLPTPFVSSAANALAGATIVKNAFNTYVTSLGTNTRQRARFFGTALRLAFHDAGEFDITKADTLGMDGCLSPTGPNNGLQQPVTTLTNTVVEGFWQLACNKISRADTWALVGKLAAEAASAIPGYRLPFYYGRKDSKTCALGAGRLPEHQPGLSEYQRVYVNQLGLTIRDGVTLSGAHSIGHVHPEVSGFGHPETAKMTTAQLNANPTLNAWDETPDRLDNKYFESLIVWPWINAQRNAADKKANFWIRPQKKADQPRDGIIMLNSDMVLAFPIDVSKDPVLLTNIGIIDEYCAIGAVSGGNGVGCKSNAKPPKVLTQTGTLANPIISAPSFGTPIANNNFAQVLAYTGGKIGIGAVGTDNAGKFGLNVPASTATANRLFLGDFAVSFTKLVNVGYSYAATTIPATATTNAVIIPVKPVAVLPSRATKSGALTLLAGF